MLLYKIDFTLTLYPEICQNQNVDTLEVGQK